MERISGQIGEHPEKLTKRATRFVGLALTANKIVTDRIFYVEVCSPNAPFGILVPTTSVGRRNEGETSSVGIATKLSHFFLKMVGYASNILHEKNRFVKYVLVDPLKDKSRTHTRGRKIGIVYMAISIRLTEYSFRYFESSENLVRIVG